MLLHDVLCVTYPVVVSLSLCCTSHGRSQFFHFFVHYLIAILIVLEVYFQEFADICESFY